MKTVISLALVSFIVLISGSFAWGEEVLRQEGELIIKFKAQSQSGEEDILKVLADIISFHHLKDTLEEKKEVKVLNSYAWANIHHVQIPEGETLEHMIEEIQKLEEVEYVEPNYLFHVDASTEAMDYKEAAANSSSSGGAQSGQALASGGQSVTVAVIDTGVDYNHPDLKDNMWKNPGETAGNATLYDRLGTEEKTTGRSSAAV